MIRCVDLMSMRHVGMVSRFLMVSLMVMPGRLLLVMRGLLMDDGRASVWCWAAPWDLG